MAGRAGFRLFDGTPGGGDVNTPVVAYDTATGAELWAVTERLLGDGAYGVGVSPDGETVYVTGNGIRQTWLPGEPITTVAYDSADGSQRRWVAHFEVGSSMFVSSRLFDGLWMHPNKFLVTSADGKRVYVSGEMWRPYDFGNQFDFRLLAYDTTG